MMPAARRLFLRFGHICHRHRAGCRRHVSRGICAEHRSALGASRKKTIEFALPPDKSSANQDNQQHINRPGLFLLRKRIDQITLRTGWERDLVDLFAEKKQPWPVYV